MSCLKWENNSLSDIRESHLKWDKDILVSLVSSCFTYENMNFKQPFE